jgi:hypothetical protein
MMKYLKFRAKPELILLPLFALALLFSLPAHSDHDLQLNNQAVVSSVVAK